MHSVATYSKFTIKYVCDDKYSARPSKCTISKPPVQADGVTDSIQYVLTLPVINRRLLVMMLKPF